TPDLAAAHLASALGLHESDEHSTGALDVVTAYLRRRELLLVIDSCEHIAAEVAGIAGSLLGSCAGLKVLVTSRVALGVVGEVCHALAPLEAPTNDATLDEMAASPAVRLFLERADDVGSQTTRDREQLTAIAALCRWLDGLPLAIEMAAMSMRTLSPTELLE